MPKSKVKWLEGSHHEYADVGSWHLTVGNYCGLVNLFQASAIRRTQFQYLEEHYVRDLKSVAEAKAWAEKMAGV